jgi:hypothetical protein
MLFLKYWNLVLEQFVLTIKKIFSKKFERSGEDFQLV